MEETFLCTVLLFLFLNFITCLALPDTGYKFFMEDKMETRRSNLSCFQCFNGDGSDCMNMVDLQSVPTRNCMIDEPFCKVRRLSTEGHLTTFDRFCASECTPGCRESGYYYYHECVSCCNDRSFCNMDNSATAQRWRSHPEIIQWILLSLMASATASR